MKATKSFVTPLSWTKTINKTVERSWLNYVLGAITDGEITWDVPYQRDFVWTLEQKRAYVEAIFLNKATIEVVLVAVGWREFERTGLDYEVLDGKQRLSTLAEFIDGGFTIFDGYHFDDLLPEDQRFLLKKDVVRTHYRKFDNSSLTMVEKVELFLIHNDLGTRVAEEHLDGLRKFLEKEGS